MQKVKEEADLAKTAADSNSKAMIQQLQDSSREALEKREMEIARLAQEAEKLSAELSRAREESQNALDSTGRMQEVLTVLQAEAAAKDAAIANLNDAVEQLKLGESVWQAEREGHEEEVSMLRSQISQDLLPKCGELQSRADHLAEALHNAEALNVTMKKQIDMEREAWATKEGGLQDSVTQTQSELAWTREELEAARSEKVATTSKLEAEIAALDEMKRTLESQVEALTAELEDRQGQVELVQVQVTRAQRSCREVQQVYDDSVKKHLEHRNRISLALAQKLMRKSIKDEFDSWRDMTQAFVNERKIQWLEEDQSSKNKEIRDCSEMLKELQGEVRELRADGQMCMTTALKVARASIFRVQEAAAAVTAGLVKEKSQLEDKARELYNKADEAESKLAQHVKRAAHELTISQAEQERLSSKLEALLAEKASMKQDFATMMDELTEYRVKLGERGVKMSPRVQRSARPSAALPPEQEDDSARLQAEQKYAAKTGGKYFMC